MRGGKKKKGKAEDFTKQSRKTILHAHEMGSIYTKMFMAAFFLILTKQPGTP